MKSLETEVVDVKPTTGEPSRAGRAGASAPMSSVPPAGGFLSADPCALGLIRDTVREQLRQAGARGDLAVLCAHDLEEVSANVTTAVAAALDVYLDEPTDPLRPGVNG